MSAGGNEGHIHGENECKEISNCQEGRDLVVF